MKNRSHKTKHPPEKFSRDCVLPAPSPSEDQPALTAAVTLPEKKNIIKNQSTICTIITEKGSGGAVDDNDSQLPRRVKIKLLRRRQ